MRSSPRSKLPLISIAPLGLEPIGISRADLIPGGASLRLRPWRESARNPQCPVAQSFGSRRWATAPLSRQLTLSVRILIVGLESARTATSRGHEATESGDLGRARTPWLGPSQSPFCFRSRTATSQMQPLPSSSGDVEWPNKSRARAAKVNRWAVGSMAPVWASSVFHCGPRHGAGAGLGLSGNGSISSRLQAPSLHQARAATPSAPPIFVRSAASTVAQMCFRGPRIRNTTGARCTDHVHENSGSRH